MNDLRNSDIEIEYQTYVFCQLISQHKCDAFNVTRLSGLNISSPNRKWITKKLMKY